MKKVFLIGLGLLIVLSYFSYGHVKELNNKPVIVVTFTILEDFTKQVAGDLADVRCITAIGSEVHEWELTPRNFVDLEQADIVFYNGYNTEQWMRQVRAVIRKDVQVIPVAELSEYPPMPIITGGLAGDPDPHIWMDPKGAQAYVEVIRDALIELDPINASDYIANAAKYLVELESLDLEIKEIISNLPVEKKVLITSEAAFLYFAKRYGFFHDAIWGTNSEEQGTPQQMMRIIRIIREKQPAAIFWESTGSPRFAQTIAQDTGIKIIGPLYVDSIGNISSGVESYVELQRANVRLLLEVLGE